MAKKNDNGEKQLDKFIKSYDVRESTMKDFVSCVEEAFEESPVDESKIVSRLKKEPMKKHIFEHCMLKKMTTW